jgi:hypothetical protein
MAGEISWEGPCQGQKYHEDAFHQRHKNDFYAFHETPRIPRDSFYQVIFVDKFGLPLSSQDDPPLVALKATGCKLRSNPSPKQRMVVRCALLGTAPPRSPLRIYELARKLGVFSGKLLDELNKRGIKCSNVQNSLDPEVVDLLLAEYAGGLFSSPMHTSQESTLVPGKKVSPQLDPPRDRPTSRPQYDLGSAGRELDELLPIPPLIQPEYSAAEAELQQITQSVQQEEAHALREGEETVAGIDNLSREIERACGLPTEPGAGSRQQGQN